MTILPCNELLPPQRQLFYHGHFQEKGQGWQRLPCLSFWARKLLSPNIIVLKPPVFQLIPENKTRLHLKVISTLL